MEENKKRKLVYNPEADKKWAKKNKEHKSYLKYRSTARSSIKNKAALEDLDELENHIKDKKYIFKW